MTGNGLFRQEAIGAHSDTSFGQAVCYQPPALRLLIAALLVVFTLLVLFAAFAKVKQTERVRGYLLASEGEVKLYPARASVISRLEVSNGQVVTAGELLAIFSEPLADEKGVPVARQLIEYLDDQISLIEERASLLTLRAQIRDRQFESRITGTARELAVLREELELISSRIGIGKKEFDSNEVLFQKRQISEREYLHAASTWYGLQQLGKGMEQNLVGRGQVLNDLHQQRELHAIELQEELLSLELNLIQLRTQRSERQAQTQSSIVATINGKVHNLMHKEGDSVDPRTPFLTLVPESNQLEARLYLPTRAIGKVQEGQQILLSYDAFPYQTFGSFSASVESISRSTVDPREFLFPVDIREPVYLLRAKLNFSDLENHDLNLTSGMQFSADIVTGQQSLLQRMVSPLNALGRKL